jgi:hypothetical protein
LKRPKWLQRLIGKKSAVTGSDSVKRVRRESMQKVKQQDAQKERRQQAEKKK